MIAIGRAPTFRRAESLPWHGGCKYMAPHGSRSQVPDDGPSQHGAAGSVVEGPLRRIVGRERVVMSGVPSMRLARLAAEVAKTEERLRALQASISARSTELASARDRKESS